MTAMMATTGSRTLGETLDDAEGDEDSEPSPGVVLVFCDRVATLLASKVGADGLRIGRDELVRFGLRDDRISRAHAAVRWDGKSLIARDVGSRNGTFVDGVALHASEGERVVRSALRCGRSLWIAVDDVRPYLRSAVEERGGFVIGPRLRAALHEIETLAARSMTLFVRGESGTGKELAARSFHDASPLRAGPFVAVNCATIPAPLAERLFFGARRGVYSGAHEDTVGYFQAADGGTLFLDEVAELDLATQAKLLRAIETREITPLGQTKARPVDLRIVSATLAPLERAVEEGRFRADLFHRIASPSVSLPPLRERREEIPFLVRRALVSHSAEAALDVELVEQCLTRAWSGNIRQLLHELAQSANRWALATQKPLRLAPEHTPSARATEPAPPQHVEPRRRRAANVDSAAARAAVEQCGGNISAAARSLGLHRTQLRRLLTSEPATK